MNVTDIVLIVILVIFVALGAKDGFIHTLGRLIGAVVGFMLAQAWSPWLSGLLAVVMPIGWARVVAFILLFLIIERVFGLVLWIIDKAFKILSFLPFLRSIDKLLGGLLGFGEGIILLGGTIYLITTFKPVMSLYVLVTSSSVANWINGVFRALLGILLK